VVAGSPPPVLDGPLVVTELDLEPETASVTPELDRLTCLYVLEGEIVLDTQHGEIGAPAGAWVQVPAGVVASGPAAAGGPARALWIQAATGRTDSM
jgi:hypothetical protein